MGGAPKTTVDPVLQKQQKDELARAERESDRLRRERISASDASRRKQTGLFSLIKTSGGELGAKKTLLGVAGK